MSSLRIGCCALQVGHQVAWIATKIGLPAFCAAAKSSRVNGLVSVVNAGVTKTELAAAATSAARRDSMSEFPPGSCHPVFTLYRDYRTSQLSETASNFSHCCEVPATGRLVSTSVQLGQAAAGKTESIWQCPEVIVIPVARIGWRCKRATERAGQRPVLVTRRLTRDPARPTAAPV